MNQTSRLTFSSQILLPLLLSLFILIISVPELNAQPSADPISDSIADSSAVSSEQIVAPPANVIAVDHLYDVGESVDVSWDLSSDDTTGLKNIVGYIIYRSQSGSTEFDSVGAVFSRATFLNDKGLTRGETYRYAVSSYTLSGALSEKIPSAAVTTEREWFDMSKKWLLAILLIIGSSVMLFIAHAQNKRTLSYIWLGFTLVLIVYICFLNLIFGIIALVSLSFFLFDVITGKELFLRKIAGLQAVEEAIGRATEMGRPILFIPGIHDMDDVQTIAGMTILAKVAKQVAEYDSRVIVPTRASLAMTAARETVREAFMTAGRIDAYRPDDIYYVTDEQFGYVAAVNGIMTRDKPATCFYLGAFFAESLILAETGNSIGAIQIAGTAMPAQLPFFVAACDYTLIGEELFAASAYLSGEAKQLGSLKGQDVGKVVAMAAIIVGAVLATLGSEEGMNIESFRGAFHGLWGVFGGGE